ncbi:MAG: cupin domain-containing protein [Burkholderiaceae bacterium]
MNARCLLRPALAATACALSIMPVAFAADMAMVNPNDIKWGDAPPSLPKGAQAAVLSGDPGKDGPFVMRLKTPANYKIPPHTHTQAENLTVLSGALMLGMGEKIDKSSEHTLQPGGFHALPGKTPHYAMSKVPSVIQINGNGPFDISYINPADDPAKAAKK